MLERLSRLRRWRFSSRGAKGGDEGVPGGWGEELGLIPAEAVSHLICLPARVLCPLCCCALNAITAPPLLVPQWLQEPGPFNEKRTLFCDMVCFLFITPLAAISGWLCLRGAQDHLHLGSWLQAVGLITLTIALFIIYILWTLVSGPSSSSSSGSRWCVKVTAGFAACAGILPLPLPAVLGVEKNQSESASAHSRHQGVQLFPAFPAVRQADEEVGQREHSMRTSAAAPGGD